MKELKDVGQFDTFFSNPDIPFYKEEKGDFWLGKMTNGGHVYGALEKTEKYDGGLKKKRFILNNKHDQKHMKRGLEYYFNNKGVIIDHLCKWQYFRHNHFVKGDPQIIVVATVDLDQL